jgi:hypothetical protein
MVVVLTVIGTLVALVVVKIMMLRMFIPITST